MRYLLTFIATIIIALFIYPELDLAVSGYFYDENLGFFYKDYAIVKAIYFLTRFITLSLFVVSFGSSLGYYIYIHKNINLFWLKNLFTRIYSLLLTKYLKLGIKEVTFIAFTIGLIPIFAVHYMLKPLWDRARPDEILQFVGNKEFSYFYDIFTGSGGTSFPSGHSSMAFSLFVFYYIYGKRKSHFIALTLIGFVAAGCRIIMGGHYLSDVTASAFLTLTFICLSQRYFLGSR